jgi:hypothetical protein
MPLCDTAEATATGPFSTSETNYPTELSCLTNIQQPQSLGVNDKYLLDKCVIDRHSCESKLQLIPFDLELNFIGGCKHFHTRFNCNNCYDGISSQLQQLPLRSKFHTTGSSHSVGLARHVAPTWPIIKAHKFW